jgi:hypothetical protein
LSAGADAERRSRLLSLKLRALVRDHTGGDDSGDASVFALGAALLRDDAVWMLVDGESERSLGATLAWATTHAASRPVRMLVERDSGVLARRAAQFDADIELWHVDERSLLPAIADPHLPRVDARPEHIAFAEVIDAAGAAVVVEHGVVVGEVAGLEMCRVVDDATSGETRLEVGMGAHDREAFAMVHGHLPTTEALRQVIDAVAPHRVVGAPQHPFNQFAAERLLRWRALGEPSCIGFESLAPAEPPVVRRNLKDAVPCAARGVMRDGRDAVAVFASGVDLDVVPFALDAADREGVDAVAVVLRERDVVPSIEKLAARARRSVSFVTI